jgi:protein-disulfide isomerase
VAWQKVESLATVVLAIAAVSIAAVTVRREVLGGGPRTSASSRLTLSPAADWERILSTAMPLVVGDERVHIVEFTDLECPACRHFHLSTLKELDLAGIAPSFSIVHFPLPGHRFATIAATAAECAGSQGRGSAFVEAVFARQDSVGLATWTTFATAARIPDTLEFKTCLDAGPQPRVEKGLALASELGIRETPTIFLNGQRLSRPPSADELRSLVADQALPQTR